MFAVQGELNKAVANLEKALKLNPDERVCINSSSFHPALLASFPGSLPSARMRMTFDCTRIEKSIIVRSMVIHVR